LGKGWVKSWVKGWVKNITHRGILDGSKSIILSEMEIVQGDLIEVQEEIKGYLEKLEF